MVSPAPDSGTVRFLVGTLPLAGCAAVPVNPANRTATCMTTYQRPGAYQVQAIYAGDAQFAVSRSSALRQTVRSSIALTGRSSGRSGTVSFAVSCARASRGCLVGAVLSTSQTLGGQHANTKAAHRVTIAGAKTVRIAAGKSSKITIKLDPAGRKLIAALKKLRVKLTLSLVVRGAHIPVATRALTVTGTVPKPHHRG
jgi:hypothetical protein